MTKSHTCLFPSHDPHRKRRDGSSSSQSVRSARCGSSLRVGAPEELCPASGLGSGLHRASACSAGAPRRRECREKGPANDDHDEYPARTAMRPVEPGPPKRIVPPDGMRSLDGDAHPLAPPCLESAGEQAPALRSGAERGPMPRDPDTTRCRDPRGETFLGGAAPATPEGLTPPSSERSAALSLVDRRRVVFEIADHPPDAHRGRRPWWLSDSVIRVPPRARAAITSLSPDLRRPRVRDGEAPWNGERLEAEAPGRPARSRHRLRSAATLGSLA